MLSQNKRGVVYGISYKDFDKVYTGEMGRTSNIPDTSYRWK